MSEQRYTQLEFAKHECAMQGHDFDTLVEYGKRDPSLLVCTRCGAHWVVGERIDQPKITGRVISTLMRSPHRSQIFSLNFDVSNLMDDKGHSLVDAQQLETILIGWCEKGIRNALARARRDVKGHP